MSGGSTSRLISGAPRGDKQTIETGEEDAALENCPKCNVLLDVSGFRPLTETSCPQCGALIKVLREFHHFVLLSELGHGGAGTVFRAFDETLERDVALKLLRNENTRDSNYLASLEQEALVMASISHEHVVKVYSTGRKNSYFYIAMEIVGGGSLSERIAQGSPVTEAEVVSIGIQLAEGLNAAYEQGLLHRDVKPGNILFADRQTIKVADFGLAVRVEHATGDSDDLWGTPDYIAPEKLLRTGEDVRSDIYSLGCTLFHCLAGVPPLDTTTVMKILQTQVAEAAPDLRLLSPTVSKATADVIQRCLEKNPLDRYQNYLEVVLHLQYALELLEGPRPAAATPAKADSGGKAWKWIAIAGLAAIAGGAGVTMVLRDQAPRNAAAPVTETKIVAINPAPPTPAPTAPGSVAPWEQYHPLNMSSAYTADSRQIMYPGQDPNSRLIIARFGPVSVNGIPFDLANPVSHEKNITILQGRSMSFPKRVELPGEGLPIRKLHILGAVAAWGWDPPSTKNHFHDPAAKITIVYRGGASESFELLNGVEVANHTSRVDVPGSAYAEGIAENGHQVRTVSLTLTKREPVEKIVLESVTPDLAPIFVALTAETAKP